MVQSNNEAMPSMILSVAQFPSIINQDQPITQPINIAQLIASTARDMSKVSRYIPQSIANSDITEQAENLFLRLRI